MSAAFASLCSSGLPCRGGGPLRGSQELIVVLHIPCISRPLQDASVCRESTDASANRLNSCTPRGRRMLRKAFVLQLRSAEALEDNIQKLVLPPTNLCPATLDTVRNHVLRSLLVRLDFFSPPLLPPLLQEDPRTADGVRSALACPLVGFSKRLAEVESIKEKRTTGGSAIPTEQSQRSLPVSHPIDPPPECVLLSLFSWSPTFFSSLDPVSAAALGLFPSALETASAVALAATCLSLDPSISDQIFRPDTCGKTAPFNPRSSFPVIDQCTRCTSRAPHARSRGCDCGSGSFPQSCLAPVVGAEDTWGQAPQTKVSLAPIEKAIMASMCLGSCSKSLVPSVCARVACMRAISYWCCLAELLQPDPLASSVGEERDGRTPAAESRAREHASNGQLSSQYGKAADSPTGLSPYGSLSSALLSRRESTESLSTEPGGRSRDVFPTTKGPRSAGTVALYTSASAGFPGRDTCCSRALLEGQEIAPDEGGSGPRARPREFGAMKGVAPYREATSSGSRLLQQLQESFAAALEAVLARQHESLQQLRERQSAEMEDACGRREEHSLARGVADGTTRKGEGPFPEYPDSQKSPGTENDTENAASKNSPASGASGWHPSSTRVAAESERGPSDWAARVEDQVSNTAETPDASGHGHRSVQSQLASGRTEGSDSGGRLSSLDSVNSGSTTQGAYQGRPPGVAGDQKRGAGGEDGAAVGLEALVLQHVSEFELLELHWWAERALLRRQQLQDFKDVAIDLFLLHKAAVDGRDSPLILPPLPSAHESDLLPADWHPRQLRSVSAVDKEGDAVASRREWPDTYEGRGTLQSTSEALCSRQPRGSVEDERLRQVLELYGPSVANSPVNGTSSPSMGRRTRASNESSLLDSVAPAARGKAATSLQKEAPQYGKTYMRHSPLPAALHIVTPTSILRRFVESRRKLQQAQLKTRQKALKTLQEKRSPELPPPIHQKQTHSTALARRNSISECNLGGTSTGLLSRTPAGVLRPPTAGHPPITHNRSPAPHPGKGNLAGAVGVGASSGGALLPPPPVVDIDALLSPSAWEEGLSHWPEEQLIGRLRQHALLPLMFGQQRKRSLIVRICTGTVTDIVEEASQQKQPLGSAAPLPTTTTRSMGPSAKGNGPGDVYFRSSLIHGGCADYLTGLPTTYDYHEMDYLGRSDFFPRDKSKPGFCYSGGGGGAATLGGCLRRLSVSSAESPQGGVFSANLSGHGEGSTAGMGNLPGSVSGDAEGKPANVSSPAVGQSGSSSNPTRRGRETEDDGLGYRPTDCLGQMCGGGSGCCSFGSSFALVGAAPPPLVGIVLPVGSSLELRAPAYQRWRARIAAANDFVFPGIDEQERMLDVYLDRRSMQDQAASVFLGQSGMRSDVLQTLRSNSAADGFPSRLDVGEIFISRHSNGDGIHVVFHLAVNGASRRKSVSPGEDAKTVGGDPSLLSSDGSGQECRQRQEVLGKECKAQESSGAPSEGHAVYGQRALVPETSTRSQSPGSTLLRENEAGATVAMGRPASALMEDEASLSPALQRGIKEVLSLSSAGGVRTLVLPLLLMEGGAGDCSLPYALLQRRVFNVLRCVMNELKSICSSSGRSPQLRQLVLVLPQQPHSDSAKPGLRAEGEEHGEWRAQDERWMECILKSTINFIRNCTHCCTLK